MFESKRKKKIPWLDLGSLEPAVIMSMWFHDQAGWVASHPIHPPWISPWVYYIGYLIVLLFNNSLVYRISFCKKKKFSYLEMQKF